MRKPFLFCWKRHTPCMVNNIWVRDIFSVPKEAIYIKKLDTDSRFAKLRAISNLFRMKDVSSLGWTWMPVLVDNPSEQTYTFYDLTRNGYEKCNTTTGHYSIGSLAGIEPERRRPLQATRTALLSRFLKYFRHI